MDWDPDSHISTMGGTPVACAAALAVLDLIKSEHLLENSTRLGNHTRRRFHELAEKHNIIGDVRGKGLMIGLEIVKNPSTKEPATLLAQKIIRKSFRRGVLLVLSGSSVVQITPPLNITKDLLDQGLEIVESAISEVATQL
jgi:4-aminobutyrate aminotransferase